MATQERELNADGYLKKLMENPSVIGYIVFNIDGIPMRYDGIGMTHKMAVHYSALITHYWSIVKRTMQKSLREIFVKPSQNHQVNHVNSGEMDVEYLRMRTAKETELIITSYGEFYIVCIQYCGQSKYNGGEEDNENMDDEDN